MLEQIISRGLFGAERAAMEVAQICKVAAGGHSWHGATSRDVGRRLGLVVTTDCRREALLRNVREADGTLLMGTVPTRFHRMLGTRVFLMEQVVQRSPRFLAEWIERFDVRTLNVVGRPTAAAARDAGWLILDTLAMLGHDPVVPMANGCRLVVDRRTLYAFRAWPSPLAWVRRENQWWPVKRWQRVFDRLDWPHWLRMLDAPGEVRDAIAQPGKQIDCGLLSTLSQQARRR